MISFILGDGEVNQAFMLLELRLSALQHENVDFTCR